MKKLILTLVILLFVCAQLSYSVQPTKIEPIPDYLFHPVIIPQAPRPKPDLPKPEIIVVPVAPKATSHLLTGVATWYCKTGVSRCTVGHPSGYYAAIRKDLLELRGRTVLVCASRCVKVKIIDCNCGASANLIDLYYDAFRAISDPRLGRVRVTIKW